jgi:hypothetical protein
MCVCEHSSQRTTCPPRAAVRQLSMAEMTFNCPRLTWPALARRQAAPKSRKISATSKAGRITGGDATRAARLCRRAAASGGRAGS